MEDIGRQSHGIPERTARGWVLLASPPMALVIVLATALIVALASILALHTIPTQAQLRIVILRWAPNYFVQMGITIFVYLALLLAMWLLLPKRGPAALKSYFARIAPSTMAAALASGVAFAILLNVALAIVAQSGVSFHETSAERALLPHGWAQTIAALLAIAVAGPAVEEIYFRGLLLRWLRQRMSLWLAAIPDAVLFAVTHFRFTTHIGLEGWVITSGLFAFGLFAVAWAGRTNSVWPAIAAHGSYNAALISVPLAMHTGR
ncbi:MAG: CPBP family intramembrane metalloprotease [Alphaproteobacteria bacterium]|nr:CPBP family intramembrane metalloprotease [Alphaproteobacteria bacterium]